MKRISLLKIHHSFFITIVGLASMRRERDQEMKSEEKEERRLVTELRRKSALIYCVMMYACPYTYDLYNHLVS